MRIVCLPGDGVGPEVTAAAATVLGALAPDIDLEEHPFGGAAILETGTPLPEETLAACLAADAVLLGAVGLPQFDAAAVRPEQGLMALRRRSTSTPTCARPADPASTCWSSASWSAVSTTGREGRARTAPSSIRASTTPTRSSGSPGTPSRSPARAGSSIASVDKANVLETSRMWRRVVTEVGGDYPDVDLEHVLVDAAAMHLVQDPARFDVILTENMFGDILSDEAAGLTGGLGLAASASLGDQRAGDLRARPRLRPRHRRPRDREPGRDAPLGRAPARARPRPARAGRQAAGGGRRSAGNGADPRSRRRRDHRCLRRRRS